jgi:hypothetical protein
MSFVTGDGDWVGFGVVAAGETAGAGDGAVTGALGAGAGAGLGAGLAQPKTPNSKITTLTTEMTNTALFIVCLRMIFRDTISSRS